MAKQLIYNFVFNPGTSTVVVPGNVPLRKLLLITNVSTGTIIYNFADSTKTATYSYSSTTNETTFTLAFNVSAMLATHQLQIFKDELEVEIKPNFTYQDPVEKLRVSTPQAMIDTDFEYSLQASKWESVGLTNNMPSVFVASNEPAFTNDQINWIRPVSLGGGSGVGTLNLLSTNIPADRTSTGLTTRFGTFNSASGTDEASVSITFPAGYNQSFQGNTYTFGHINANGWLGFGTTSSSGFAGNQSNPNTPTLHLFSVNNGSTDNNLAFCGTEEYTDGFWGLVFRIRVHMNNVYSTSNLATQTQFDLYFVKNQPGLYIIVIRNFVTDGFNEQLGISSGSSWVDLKQHNLNGVTFTNGQAWQASFASSAAQYAIEVNFTISHGRSVGSPINIRESANSSIDGSYIVANVDSASQIRYIPKTSDVTVIVESKAGSYSQVGTAVTVTFTSHGYKIGDKIFLTPTTGTLTSGTYEVQETPAPTANTFVVFRSTSTTTSGNTAMFKNYKTPYTAIYTGGFYSNSNIPLNVVAEVSGTTRARLTFTSPHGFFVGNSIYVIDTTVPTALWVGAFTVDRILSSTIIEYTTRSGSVFSTSNTLSSAATVYARADSLPIHRSGDGGVQINPGTNSVNAQIIRQTRKYFRYQSGKGIQFSTGILLRPVYDINSITVDTSTISGSGFMTLTIETEIEHGFAVPAAGGPLIRLRDFTVTTGTNPYNVNGQVFSIVSNKVFTMRITTGSAPGDTSPGGFRTVEVLGWYDATVRTGLFDEQNGLFWEFNGTELFMVRRQSTQQLAGTGTIVTGSPFVYGTKTKFLSTVLQGDYIVIQGQSFIVNEVFSDTKLVVTPRYRASNNAVDVKLFKTQELRVRQKDFSIDQLDGSGPSGYTLDLNKMQMVFLDYSWYGAGKARFGVRATEGRITYFHEMPNNNINTEAYMRSGNLPARFEIQNRSNRTILTDSVVTNTAFTWSVAANSDIVSVSSTTHGLFVGNTILFDFAATLSDGLYEILSSNFTANSFEIRLNAAAKDAASGSGTFQRSIVSSAAAPMTIGVADARYFPPTGRLVINNEYFSYDKISTTGASYTQTGNVINITGIGTSSGVVAGSTVNLVVTTGTATSETYTVLASPAPTATTFSASSYYPAITSGLVNVFLNNRMSLTVRNVFGLTTPINASKNDTVYSYNQNVAPSLSHWGTSVIMDGMFDEDKSYLFTGTSTAVNYNNILTTKPVVSIRLAPSADYGIPRDWGVRSLVNRSALTLKRVGVYTRGTGYLIELKINCTSTVFNTPANFKSVGNGSLAQALDHGALGGTVAGGDTVFAFFAEEGSGRFAVTDKEIDFIRELGNSVLGGALPYPDGPDILTIFATPTIQVATNADVRARLSWTESQG